MTIKSENAMRQLGQQIGAKLKGGELVELVGDIGAGKTTLTKGLATGLGVEDVVQSPSFTISRTYQTAREGQLMAHYDFYRLNDPGIMISELDEAIQDKDIIVVIEWAEIVNDLLPEGHIRVMITPISDTERQVKVEGVKL